MDVAEFSNKHGSDDLESEIVRAALGGSFRATAAARGIKYVITPYGRNEIKERGGLARALLLWKQATKGERAKCS